jgi:hypothetical protein
MSVASMAKLAQENATAPPNPLGLLTAYIPSEAIAVYIGALGILIPTADATPDQVGRVRLVCFFAGLLVAIIIAFANFDRSGITDTREVWRRRIVVAVLAVVAFAVYAAATPSFFYDDAFLTIPFTQWAAAGALVTAVVLPIVAKALGVRQV